MSCASVCVATALRAAASVPLCPLLCAAVGLDPVSPTSLLFPGRDSTFGFWLN